jgi:hypothetical protein
MDYARRRRRRIAHGELAAWCQIFLRGEGASVGLADPLRERDDDVYVLAEVDLEDVYPITRPEEDFESVTQVRLPRLWSGAASSCTSNRRTADADAEQRSRRSPDRLAAHGGVAVVQEAVRIHARAEAAL